MLFMPKCVTLSVDNAFRFLLSIERAQYAALSVPPRTTFGFETTAPFNPLSCATFCFSVGHVMSPLVLILY